EADLEQGRRLAAGLADAAKALKSAIRRRDEQRARLARLEQARATLAELGPTRDEAALDAELAGLEAEGESLRRCLKAHEAERSLIEWTLDQLRELARAVEGRRTEADRARFAERARAEELRSSLARARSTVVEPWRAAFDSATLADLDALEHERRSLRD